MIADDFETCPPGTMKELERLRAMESRLQELLADYEYLRRKYSEGGGLLRAEMYAERIAQVEAAMIGGCI